MAALATGCATITRGSHQAFSVETEPSGAHVSTTLGLSSDATPCTFPRVDREAEFQVTITKEATVPGQAGSHTALPAAALPEWPATFCLAAL